MSGILSALGPKAIKAVIAGIIAGLTALAAQIEAGAAADLWLIIKTFGAALFAHQGAYWVPNKG